MTSGESHLPDARWRTVVVALVVALGITLSLSMFFRARMFERATLQSAFSQRATAGATAIQRSVQEHLEVLYSLGAVYTAMSRPLDREVFREFNVAGRTWSVLFHPLPDLRHTPSWQAWGGLVGGLLFTIVCAGILLLKWRWS